MKEAAMRTMKLDFCFVLYKKEEYINYYMKRLSLK
jgi:hypothetical protein